MILNDSIHNITSIINNIMDPVICKQIMRSARSATGSEVSILNDTLGIYVHILLRQMGG